MVNHFVDRQQLAIVAGGGGELAEHVLPAALGPAALRFLGEILDQIFPTVGALLHLGEGQRMPDRRDGGLDHVHEGLVHLVCFLAEGNADETVRRKVERQLLDGGVELHATRAPFLHTVGNAAVEAADVVAHRLWLERDRQRLAVGPVMVEIHQHQPAREQLVEDRAPALLAGENLLAVEQHQFVRVRADQRHGRPAERLVAVHAPVFFHHRAGEGGRIGQHPEGVADDGQARLAGNVREVRRVRIILFPVRGARCCGLVGG